MDFSNRGSQQSPAAPRASGSFPADGASAGKGGKVSKFRDSGKLVKVGAGILLAAVAVLILAVLALSIFGGGKAESSYVDSSKLQAVFLTNDQVYFGKIGQLNNKTPVLSDIYYLRTQSDSTTQSTSNNNVSLVKLGCELLKPYDRMVINRDQVQFWENLQSDGQVAAAVKQYQQTNPTNNCSNSTNGSASGSSVQGSTTPTTNTNTSTTTKQ